MKKGYQCKIKEKILKNIKFNLKKNIKRRRKKTLVQLNFKFLKGIIYDRAQKR
jgi:hypothetical protein